MGAATMAKKKFRKVRYMLGADGDYKTLTVNGHTTRINAGRLDTVTVREGDEGHIVVGVHNRHFPCYLLEIFGGDELEILGTFYWEYPTVILGQNWETLDPVVLLRRAYDWAQQMPEWVAEKR